MTETKTKPKVHLVLASGGARGVAHIGVIERLEEEGYEIVEIAGCSMGAVIGGLYAAGALDKYKEWLLKLQRADVFRLLDFTFAKHGFLKGEKVFSTITDFIGPQKIEDLKIPFRAVATNLTNGEEVVFKDGDLYHALRASISIPGIFTPVTSSTSSEVLVDGGVVNPLPLNQVSRSEQGIIVAVDINGKGQKPKIMVTDKEQEKDNSTWFNINWPFWKKDEQNKEPGFMDVLSTSYEHMQHQLISRDLKLYQPESLINIPRDTCGVFDFHKSKELIAVGRQAFDEQFSLKREF
jgi:NTE family protein